MQDTSWDGTLEQRRPGGQDRLPEIEPRLSVLSSRWELRQPPSPETVTWGLEAMQWLVEEVRFLRPERTSTS